MRLQAREKAIQDSQAASLKAQGLLQEQLHKQQQKTASLECVVQNKDICIRQLQQQVVHLQKLGKKLDSSLKAAKVQRWPDQMLLW